MTRASMIELVRDAAVGGGAVGAFNVVTLENAEAIAIAAESLQSAVILQVSQNTVDYHSGLAALGAACLKVADGASVPIAVHLDHASSIELCKQAARIGFGSVMFDGSSLPWEENLARTSQVVKWAHSVGVSVEAELGHVAGKAGDTAASELTDPGHAAEYVARTGADALAVSVGTAHHMTSVHAVLDIERILALRSSVPTPLVLHGSSGVSDEQLRAAVRAGIAKVNIATHINMAFTKAVRAALKADPQLVDLRRYLGPGRDAMALAVAQKIVVLRSA